MNFTFRHFNYIVRLLGVTILLIILVHSLGLNWVQAVGFIVGLTLFVMGAAADLIDNNNERLRL